jgi:hypothetical protein
LIKLGFTQRNLGRAVRLDRLLKQSHLLGDSVSSLGIRLDRQGWGLSENRKQYPEGHRQGDPRKYAEQPTYPIALGR